MSDNNCLAFKQLMSKIPEGKIEDRVVSSKVEAALNGVWHLLDTAQVGGMLPEKLLGRMEKIEWKPPILTFVVERHGATVMGSVYADLQDWQVNVAECTATLAEGKKRLLGAKQPPLKVEPLVTEIVELIAKCQEDDRLKWAKGNQRVQIQIGKIIPDDVAPQTLQGRRRRFSKLLEQTLAEMGWKKVTGPHHTYEKADQ